MLLRIESALRYSIFMMGFTALATQIVLLREALNIFYGNELVIGILLANWMLLTGAGTYLGRFVTHQENNYISLTLSLLILAALPLLTVIGLNLAAHAIVHPGVLFSPGQVVLLTFTVLAPFCMLSGALFTFFSTALSGVSRQFSIGRVYGIEAIGSICGGLIFSLLLFHWLSTFQSLYLLFWLNLSAVMILSISNKYRWLMLVAGLYAISIIPLVIFADIDLKITQIQYPDQEIIAHRETPYGKIVLTEQAGQINFYDNAALYCTSQQIEQNEELVHFTLAQHEHPKNILLVSGGIAGTTLEILKYPDIHIDYVEINPAWIEIGHEFTTAITHPEINPLTLDARKYIRNTSAVYDAVIIDLPPPTTAQLNRFYTAEFFREVKSVLSNDAVVSTHLPSSANYMSPEQIISHSMLSNSLKSTFEHLIIFPGSYDYFIASDATLSFDIIEHLLDRGIVNTYVNAYYYVPELVKMRSDKIMESLDPSLGINRDLKPSSYFIHLQYWLSHFKYNFWFLGLILIVLSAAVILFSKNINKALFISGFTGASMEFVLIISFQVLYGYVYQMTGLLITLFMGGLATGALVLPKIWTPNRRKYFLFQIAIGTLVIFIPLAIQYLSGLNGFETLTIIVINGFSFMLGLLLGFQFTQAAYLQDTPVKTAASSTYAVDLLGSAAGSLATALILVPLLGIVETCMIIAGINFLISIFVLKIRRKV